MQPSLASEPKAAGKPCPGFPPSPFSVKAELIAGYKREEGWVEPWLLHPQLPQGEIWHKSSGASLERAGQGSSPTAMGVSESA